MPDSPPDTALVELSPDLALGASARADAQPGPEKTSSFSGKGESQAEFPRLDAWSRSAEDVFQLRPDVRGRRARRARGFLASKSPTWTV